MYYLYINFIMSGLVGTHPSTRGGERVPPLRASFFSAYVLYSKHVHVHVVMQSFFHPHLPRTRCCTMRVIRVRKHQDRNSICGLFNFHRLFISQLVIRYYDTLNYYIYKAAHICRDFRISRCMVSRKRAKSGARSNW